MVAEHTGPDTAPSGAESAHTSSAQGGPGTRPLSAAFPQGSRWGRHDLLWRVLAAAGSGLAQLLALPPYGWWWLAPLSAALIAFAVAGARLRRAAWLGLLAGAALMFPLIKWQEVFGADVWLVIAAAESLYYLPMGMGLALALRLPGWPVWTAALWVLQEAVRARFPLGGFPWGKLAFSQPETPFTGYAALGSSPLVSFALALAGALLLWSVLRAVPAGPGAQSSGAAALGVLACAAIVAFGSLAPAAGARATGAPAPSHTLTVALVQGNVPGVGEADITGERMQVLDNHMRGIHTLAEQVRAGQVDRPDMVLLPENASDIDPYRDPVAEELVSEAARDIGVPLLLGISRFHDEGTREVQSLVWDPRSGPGEAYSKRYLVPFGEYIPYRDFFTRYVERLEQVSSDAVPGTEPGALEVAGTTLAVGICFDVAFDPPIREAVAEGGQVLVVPTNNANYNFTGQSEQQLAITRLRAVEHGRSAVVVSTSGISAVVGPDGGVSYRSPEAEPAVHVAEVTAVSGPTVATRLGALPEVALSALALAAVAGALIAAGRRRRGAPADGSRPRPGTDGQTAG